MKLSALASEYNLEPGLLREVVEEDLKIRLAKGMDTVLADKDVTRILACDGLETADGKLFTPIIPQEFEDKHKRTLAAKKAAETRKAKIGAEAKKKLEEEAAKLEEERRKHQEEVTRRENERLALETAAAASAARRAEAEAIAKSEIEAARTAAEDDLRRREADSRRISAELSAMRESAQADATPAPAVESAAPTPAAATTATAPTMASPAPAAVAATPPPQSPIAGTSDAVKAAKGLGSKLASMAKATHEKADHSHKVVPPVKLTIDPHGATISKTGNDVELTADDRRRLIQDNIRKNLAMAAKVRDIKAADRARKKPGFATIDRSKTPGGPPGPGGRGPGRGPMRPGAATGPGRGAARGRDNRDHRDQPGDIDEATGKRINRRRVLSTEEQDLSGKTEFNIALPCTVREFSESSGIKSSVVIAKLFMAGMVANINSTLDKDSVDLLAQEFKKTVVYVEQKTAEEELDEVLDAEEDAPDQLAPRPPVVTIMGHVDHGKTSLLDAIRKTQVADGEAGGITQHIGAYTVSAPNGLEVTFIDTPGHQAFTAMRARGAKVTDVAVIVVDAVDGIMPQTTEAINHAKAAGVAIVVAMNKVDKPEATKEAQERVVRQLAEQGLQGEEWGGEVGIIRVSAKTGVGIDELLDRLALEADVLELTANHFAKASGTVLESHRHEGQGVTATLLVQRGTLAVGDVVLASTGYGRVRALTKWTGDRVDIAGPSHAVEVIGLSELPPAGERFTVVDDLSTAADAALARSQRLREKELSAKAKVTTTASVFGAIADSQRKEVKIILKCDASGSLEVLNKTIPELSTDEVKVTLIHSGVGAINSTDIGLAEASKAFVAGFHVIADAKARSQADSVGIEIRTYTIIYELLDDLKKAASGLLEPEYIEKVIGHAEVKATFDLTKAGVVAGLMVSDGKVTRDAGMRITRDLVIIHTGTVNTLRRFKEDVREVKEGFECGMTISDFDDVKVGDVMEFFTKEKRARSL